MGIRETSASATELTAGPLVEPIPLTLLDAPLEYIFAQHDRQRSICTALLRFAKIGRANRAEADLVSAYLAQDLGLHHRDEDEDLFPAMRRRALPEDNLGAVLARLAEDHRLAEPTAEAIVDALSARPAEGPVRVPKPARQIMLAFAASERRHVAIENGVVLAIAQIRLTRHDLRALSRAMKDRRRIAY